MRLLFLAAWVPTLVVALAGSAWAQPAELVTDRPDRTESAVTVPKGALQVEFGALWLFERSPRADLDVVEVPGSLVRYGLWERAELRLGWGGWTETWLDTASERSRSTGITDPEIGVKWAIVDPGARRLNLAVIGHVSLPVGDEVVGSPSADPSVRLAAAYPLGDRLSLGGNLGYELRTLERATGGSRTLGRWVYTAAMGIDLAPRWGAFFELFGDLPGSDPGRAVHAFDGGVTCLLASLVQLDVSVGFGTNEEAPDRFAGVGLSFRVPK